MHCKKPEIKKSPIIKELSTKKQANSLESTKVMKSFSDQHKLLHFFFHGGIIF